MSSKECRLFETPPIGEPEENALARIGALQKNLRFRAHTPRRWHGVIRRVLAAKHVVNSNSIEGFVVSAEDGLELSEGEESDLLPGDPNRRAVEGYRQALTFTLQTGSDHPIDPSTLRSMHFMMTSFDLSAAPGRWREKEVFVVNESTGATVYEGPDPDSVPDLVDCLVDELASDSGAHPIVRAAMAHLNYTMIHPHKDGNGRMSRALQTWLLVRNDIGEPEFASIEEFLGHGENTIDYYAVLSEVGQGAWNPQNDAMPWVRFCLKAHFVQAASVLRRLDEAEQRWSALEELVAIGGVPERSIEALHFAALGYRLKNSSYRWAVGQIEEVSEQVASKDLKKLVDADLLVRTGSKRGSAYHATNKLVEVQNRILAGRKPIDASRLFETP